MCLLIRDVIRLFWTFRRAAPYKSCIVLHCIVLYCIKIMSVMAMLRTQPLLFKNRKEKKHKVPKTSNSEELKLYLSALNSHQRLVQRL